MHTHPLYDPFCNICRRANQRENALIDGLLRYGRHEEGCPDFDNDPPWHSCECGFAEAVAVIQP